ncbi:MAG: MMPL family transporter [bacterium]|nr:MMPL family transporter [bacterium]
MGLQAGIIRFSVDHPRLVVALTLAAAAGCAALGVTTGARSGWEIVDTDPENMLAPTEEVRRFHDGTKEEFSLHDMIVVGVVNEEDPDGVFNPATLSRVLRLTEFAKGLDGVIPGDVIAPSEVDNIEQAGPGVLRFERLMAEPPADREGAREVRRKARNHPMLDGTLLSEDGKALCLYVPIREKRFSHRVAGLLRAEAARLGMREMDGRRTDGDAFGITGLPVAEDTFGVEMFRQMAVSAPLAMAVILLLMLLFFRKFVLVLSPMIVAALAVVCTMGLLVGLGHTVHIMSSMIPIFLMPISVVDSVHILSGFFERYRRIGDPRAAVISAMEELFTPMLYTSLTTFAGFASLALTPIPPVQTYGVFVGAGVMIAWALTVTFIPAYTTFIPKRRLDAFGAGAGEGAGIMAAPLAALGRFAVGRSRMIIAATVAVIAVSAWGISRIRVNDNPTKWFVPSHPIRVADRVLNEHFAGTYMAYLVLDPASPAAPDPDGLAARLAPAAAPLGAAAGELGALIRERAASARTEAELVAAVDDWCADRAAEAPDEEAPRWEALLGLLSEERARADLFKRPEVLRYMEGLERAVAWDRLVGKSNSAATLVAHVHRELRSGTAADFRIPDTARMVAECYIQAQSGHDPEDLWKLVTPGYGRANVWMQLRSGDNRDMEAVARAVERHMAGAPPPLPLISRWAGLTWVNVVWQDRMVSGMLGSLLGSFLVVFLMMAFLFRSFLWGILCMVPLSVTITFIYALIGISGKDYDMPVAVLSSLTLGLSVDFAIHYLQRARECVARTGEWRAAAMEMAGEPARAISRNVIVIAVGFTPLLLAPLVPYRTVGFFMAAIMVVSGAGTLVILPALMTALRRRLFAPRAPAAACSCAACLAVGLAATAGTAFVLHQYRLTGWGGTTLAAGGLVVGAMLACNRLARRRACLEELGKPEGGSK